MSDEETPYYILKLERLLRRIKKELDGQPLVRMMDMQYYKLLTEDMCKEIESLKI